MFPEFDGLWNNPNDAQTSAPLPTATPTVPAGSPQVNVNPADPPALQALAQAINTIASLTQAQAEFAQNQHSLQQTLSNIALTLGQGNGTTSTPSIPSGTVRFHDPRVFDGSPASVEPFLVDLRNAIHLQRRNLVTDYDKSIYLSTWLQDGSPKSWFWAIEKTNPQLLNNHAALLEDFRRHFGDSDFVNSQMAKIEKLTQRSSASKYASAFREIMVHLPIHDDLIKINMFKKGLRSDVKALFVTLTGSNLPATFDAYVAQAVAFDNSLHAQARELKVNRNNLATLLPIPSTASAPPANVHTHHAASNDPVPMEVDAVRHHGPVSAEERQRRRDNNLCAYCGGKHSIDTCGALAKRGKRPTGSSQQGKAKPEAQQ